MTQQQRGASPKFDYFNPHSRKGSDKGVVIPDITSHNISIHTPARGVTETHLTTVKDVVISIHTPARGVTEQKFAEQAEQIISIHTPARGVTKISLPFDLAKNISIHTPARGVTNTFLSTVPLIPDFNPHSRKGSDKKATPDP